MICSKTWLFSHVRDPQGSAPDEGARDVSKVAFSKSIQADYRSTMLLQTPFSNKTFQQPSELHAIPNWRKSSDVQARHIAQLDKRATGKTRRGPLNNEINFKALNALEGSFLRLRNGIEKMMVRPLRASKLPSRTQSHFSFGSLTLRLFTVGDVRVT